MKRAASWLLLHVMNLAITLLHGLDINVYTIAIVGPRAPTSYPVPPGWTSRLLNVRRDAHPYRGES